MKLARDAAVSYSQSERELFALLSKRRRSTTSLVEMLYREEVPYHARTLVNNLLRSLALKIKINREPFYLVKSRRNGPHSIDHWLEERIKR